MTNKEFNLSEKIIESLNEDDWLTTEDIKEFIKNETALIMEFKDKIYQNTKSKNFIKIADFNYRLDELLIKRKGIAGYKLTGEKEQEE